MFSTRFNSYKIVRDRSRKFAVRRWLNWFNWHR